MLQIEKEHLKNKSLIVNHTFKEQSSVKESMS